MLVAPDGTGRTETLTCIVETLEARDIRAVRVAGRRADRDVRFAVFEDLFDGNVPGKGSSGERSGRTQLAERCAGAVLVVDDAHWLDDASRRVLAALTRTPRRRDVGVIVATRPAVARDGDEIVGAVASTGTIVAPDPLDDADVAGRAARVAGHQLDAGVVDALLDRTAGHARLVDTLVAAWPEDEDEDTLTVAATDTVVAATSDLSPEAREALVALALGTGPDDGLHAALVGVKPKDVPNLWAELTCVGVLVPGHDEPVSIVASVVEARTDTATRRDMHRRLAELLATRGAPPAHVAEHLVASEARGSDVADTLVAAGEAQLADAPEVAAELFERAVDAGADADALGAREPRRPRSPETRTRRSPSPTARWPARPTRWHAARSCSPACSRAAACGHVRGTRTTRRSGTRACPTTRSAPWVRSPGWPSAVPRAAPPHSRRPGRSPPTSRDSSGTSPSR